MPPAAPAPSQRGSVWLYLPNLIGYARVLALLGAVACATRPDLTAPLFLLYAASYLLDALDGPAARHLGQTSRFGAVLDMVTDRVSTALMLGLLAHAAGGSGRHAHASGWLLLMLLDIAAHWVQMYAAGAAGAASHKELADEPPLLTWYYRRSNLFAVCLASEAHLALALLLARGRGALEALPPLGAEVAPWGAWGVPQEDCARTLAAWAWALTAPVCALKQVISVVHLVRASQRVVALDTAERDGSTGGSSSSSSSSNSSSASASGGSGSSGRSGRSSSAKKAK
jgi:CDP-diacylglycerol--inositol 3-phosphatidyltransferase